MDTTIEKSEAIDKLAAAFCKAQGALEPAKKESTNPHFRSKYADLASVTTAVQKPLSDNGLSIIQFGRIRDGARELFTMLLHSSGQWIGGPLPLNPSKDDPQALKAAITYMRRAGIESITGLATEDDDGHGATHASPSNQSPSLSQIATQRDATKSQHAISEAQYNRLLVIAKKAGWDLNSLNAYVKSVTGGAPSEIPRNYYDGVWKHVESSPPPGFDLEAEYDIR